MQIRVEAIGRLLLPASSLPEDLLHLRSYQPIQLPLAHMLRPQPVIEIFCELVPIQDCPFHPAAAPSVGFRNHGREQRVAGLLLSMFGENEEILQVQCWQCQEARVCLKNKRISHGRPVDLKEKTFEARTLREKIPGKAIPGLAIRTVEVFVVGKRIHEPQDNISIFMACTTDK